MMNKASMKRKSVEEVFYLIGWIIIPVGFISIWFALVLMANGLIPTDCLLERYLGIYCPGCGGTRAVFSLMRGRILRSLWYYPAVLYMAVLYIAFMGSHTIERLSKTKRVRGLKFHDWYLYLLLGLILVNCIVKNVLRFRFGILM
jgi:hypothetical protein